MEDFIDPNKILENLDLKPDMMAADFGCGSGGSTIPLAKKLYEGLVYAFDAQEGPLNALKGRSISEKINNIKAARADLEKLNSTKLRDSYVDVVIIINVIFQSDDKEGMISEAKRILKPGGQLMIVDWKPGAGFGAIAQGRVSIKDLKKTAEKINGLKLKKEFEAGKFHYGLILVKI